MSARVGDEGRRAMSTPLTADEERALREAWAYVDARGLLRYIPSGGSAELVAESTGRLLATLDLVREERDESFSRCKRLQKELLGVHDALHAECDGAADLPAEIRALRAERDAEADERDGLSAENLALRSRVVELETALRRLVAGCEAWGREEDGVPEWEPVGPAYDAAQAALKGGTP